MNDRLSAQIEFLKRADMLKTVERANVLLDQSRPENSAEHSWHLALWAMVMAPLAGPDVSIDRVIRMLLLHDLVEIVVGDHPIHLETDWDELADAEQTAASQLLGLLPEDQAQFFLSLWQEFEADQTPDARFAKVLDRCQPLFQVLCASDPRPDHVDIARANLDGGRAAYLSKVFPLAYRHANDVLSRIGASGQCLYKTARLSDRSRSVEIGDTRLAPNGFGSVRELGRAFLAYHALRLGFVRTRALRNSCGSGASDASSARYR